MKSIPVLLIAAFFLQSGANAQLIIKGRVKCMNPTLSSTKGAENIVIVPSFLPSKSVITATTPSGYFEFNTGVDLQKLYEKEISVYVISQCSDCKQSVKRVFVSEDQDRKNRNDGKTYLTMKDWVLELQCTRAQLAALRADSILRAVRKQPGIDPEEMSNSSSLVGAPVFLNFLTNVISVVGVFPANFGEFALQQLDPGDIQYGRFQFASVMTNTANTGFNFSANRDYGEASLWNPSSVAFSRKNNNISLFTNLKNNGKLSGFTRLTEKLSLGLGVIYTRQDELRRGDYGLNQQSDSLSMKLKEYSVSVSPVYQVNEKLSVGVSLKSAWQNFNVPYKIKYLQAGDRAEFFDTTTKKQNFDLDLSATYKVNGSLQLGINLMNVAGSKLYADAFIPAKAFTTITQRAVGLGICYKYQRWNFGADILATQDEFYDASIGVNYVPFNNALISAGLAVKQLSYSLAFRLKHFKIGYVEDNGAMTNEIRRGRLGVLNGRVYGGFVFDID